MKKTIISFALIATAITSFAQTTLPAHSSDYYSTKSRHQKTTAWIMLSGGVTLFALGLATAQTEVVTVSDKSSALPNVLAIAGLASSLGSIPLFISAAHNKHKAAALTLDIQRMHGMPMVANRTALFQPALGIKVSL